MVSETEAKNYLYRNIANPAQVKNIKKDNTPYRVVSTESKSKEVVIKSNSFTRLPNHF